LSLRFAEFSQCALEQFQSRAAVGATFKMKLNFAACLIAYFSAGMQQQLLISQMTTFFFHIS
jgi:hypothetical protein